MLFDVHLWVLSFTTQRKASPCHLLGVMAGITQLANSCSSAGCGLMHLASEACTALLGITLSSATVRNSVHTTCSVGDVPFFLVERLPLGGLDAGQIAWQTTRRILISPCRLFSRFWWGFGQCEH